LAERHPRASFILAHIGGGGDYMHTFPAVVDTPNIYPDLSGSGVDRGMLDAVGLSRSEIENIRWRNAIRIFPPGSFPRASASGRAAA
jgi:hypothetical protein